jgi:hypothetical protein
LNDDKDVLLAELPVVTNCIWVQSGEAQGKRRLVSWGTLERANINLIVSRGRDVKDRGF